MNIDVDLLAQALIMASQDIQETARPEGAGSTGSGAAGEAPSRTTDQPDDYPDS